MPFSQILFIQTITAMFSVVVAAFIVMMERFSVKWQKSLLYSILFPVYFIGITLYFIYYLIFYQFNILFALISPFFNIYKLPLIIHYYAKLIKQYDTYNVFKNYFLILNYIKDVLNQKIKEELKWIG